MESPGSTPCFPSGYWYNSGLALALLHLTFFKGHRLVAETRSVSAFSGGGIKVLITQTLDSIKSKIRDFQIA